MTVQKNCHLETTQQIEQTFFLKPQATRMVPRIGGFVCATLLCAAPLFVSGYAVTLAVEVMIAGVFASGINLLIGYTGLVSLGQAMFIGFGGYGIAIGTALLGFPLWVSTPATLPFNQDEETSGIIDITSIMATSALNTNLPGGAPGGKWLISSDQAHYTTGITASQVEGGQLFVMHINLISYCSRGSECEN